MRGPTARDAIIARSTRSGRGRITVNSVRRTGVVVDTLRALEGRIILTRYIGRGGRRRRTLIYDE